MTQCLARGFDAGDAAQIGCERMAARCMLRPARTPGATIPAVSSKGFKAYYFVRTADGAVLISVYEDEAGANESTNAAANWLRASLPELGGSTPQVSSGEVLLSA